MYYGFFLQKYYSFMAEKNDRQEQSIKIRKIPIFTKAEFMGLDESLS